MIEVCSTALVSRGIDIYRSFISDSQRGQAGDGHLKNWLAYLDTITESVSAGSLDANTASDVLTIADNMVITAKALLAMDRDSENAITSLSANLQSMSFTRSAESTKRRSTQNPLDRSRSSKRCRPTTTKYLPSPSPPPPSFGIKTKSTTSATSTTPSTTLTPAPTPAQDPVRLFFLTHLSNPYPTPTEKDKLCKKAKITRRKLESDLTNWRRRSDWTEIMNVYCAGDKGAMRRLVECVESGEENDVTLLERFGRMRAYLEKRDEQPGEWVLKLSEMVESGRLDLLRSRQNADDSDTESEAEGRSEAETYEDQDRDAEGESDEELQEIEFRFQPASIPTPSTASTKYGSAGLFTSVPLDIPTFTPVSGSPLTELSPTSSTGSHVAITTTHIGQQGLQPSQQEVSGYSTPYIPRGASAKSSYSSLSAASNLALSEGSSRKRNISDSSTSTSLRSVSGSSSSSDQSQMLGSKRPAGKESFTRSSRSRVEDILSDHTQEPGWVAGHQPQTQFHIGQDPRYIPQPDLRTNIEMYGIPPPPYEMGGDMTPYLMPPPQTPGNGQGQAGWNVEGGFNFTPMPHMAHFEKGVDGVEGGVGGVGGFEMPREYDFTFGGVVGGSR